MSGLRIKSSINLGGRPSKLNEELMNGILDDIDHHVPYKIAAQANGISERTLYYWIDRGHKDLDECVDSGYSRFLQSLRKIEAEKIRQHIQKITSSTKGHKGSQWVLEHVFWKYFSSYTAHIELNERLENLEKLQFNE